MPAMPEDYAHEIAELRILLGYVGFHPKARSAVEGAIAALERAARVNGQREDEPVKGWAGRD